MEIYVVKPGDNLYSISQAYSLPISRILIDNQLNDPARLAVGQTLVLQFPQSVYTVQPGDTLLQLSLRFGISIRQLQRNNPDLEGGTTLYPGQTLVLTFQQEKEGILSVNGYAYPFIDKDLLRATLPYLTNLTPFTYGITPEGGLVELEDEELIAMARQSGVAPLMHLSTLTDDGVFSNELANLILNDLALQSKLIEAILNTILEKGYSGLDIDFEFVFPQDALAYAAFIRRLAQRLNPLGFPVIAALAPKTSASQPGLLYEGHNYREIGAAANEVLLMTYEWGYTYGPPMAVAPLPNVRQVVEYALTEIPAERIWLGIPNYGYDWPLPFIQGESKATSISSPQAVSLAIQHNVVIQYDTRAQAPFFRYTDAQGVEHEVWFEDARSIAAKLALIQEYGLKGAGYWNLMRPFPQNWRVLNALYQIRSAEPLP
jgi:spore germination protein